MTPTEFDGFGLGAIPSPPDDRDHGVPLDTAILLPSRFVLGEETKTGPAPVLNQHALPECGGYTGADVARYRAKVEGKGIPDLDPHWLYRRSRTRLGFTPIPAQGTSARAVLETLRLEGIPEVGKPATAHSHRIGSYGSLPATAAAVMTALVQYRDPVVVGTAWPYSWFRPVNGIAPKPGAIAGGHLGSIVGFDAHFGSALWMNHAGTAYGKAGFVWIPWRYLIDLWHDHWKVLASGESIKP